MIMKRIIVLVGLVVMVGTLVFATSWISGMVNNASGAYDNAAYLYAGWNIIPGTIPSEGIYADSEIQEGDIKAMWYYSPLQKKYIEVHPNTDWDLISLDDGDFALTTAMWVYSKKEGVMSYSTLEDYPPLDNRQLYSGWNFVSITPDMVESENYPDLILEDLKGTCNIERAYLYERGEWVSLLDLPEMDSTLNGKGAVFKVAEDCTLSSPEGNGNSGDIPQLP